MISFFRQIVFNNFLYSRKYLKMELENNIQDNFRILFRDTYPNLVRIALFYVHDPAVAEDITQEVFTKLWEQRRMLNKIGDIKKYLQHSIRNSSLNHLKHQRVVNKYQQEYIRQAAEEEEGPEEYLQLVQKLLEQLPQKRREVLELSIVEAKSYTEIADTLNISINTVKDHIKKAYAFLREKANKEVSDFILYFILIGKK